MNRISKILLLLLLFSIGMNVYFVYMHESFKKGVLTDIGRYIELIRTKKHMIISSIPVYNDYKTSAKEVKLRTYLLKDHLTVARRKGIAPIKDDKAITEAVKTKKLVPVLSNKDTLYYFYNVRKKYRYITPDTLRGLEVITERFQKNLAEACGRELTVKIALSSMIRSTDYQKNLRKRNSNASYESTHSFGASFDIFFDDYYLSLPEPDHVLPYSSMLTKRLKSTFGFLLGDSLNQQFKSVLTETLLELQDEGRLYVILERLQHCYHVTIR